MITLAESWIEGALPSDIRGTLPRFIVSVHPKRREDGAPTDAVTATLRVCSPSTRSWPSGTLVSPRPNSDRSEQTSARCGQGGGVPVRKCDLSTRTSDILRSHFRWPTALERRRGGGR